MIISKIPKQAVWAFSIVYNARPPQCSSTLRIEQFFPLKSVLECSQGVTILLQHNIKIKKGFRWPPLQWPGVANETPSPFFTKRMLIKIVRYYNEQRGET